VEEGEGGAIAQVALQLKLVADGREFGPVKGEAERRAVSFLIHQARHVTLHTMRLDGTTITTHHRTESCIASHATAVAYRPHLSALALSREAGYLVSPGPGDVRMVIAPTTNCDATYRNSRYTLDDNGEMNAKK
jgi:hypothetical protein